MKPREWDEADDAGLMLGFLTRVRRNRPSDRKFRLFTCAACRRAWDEFPRRGACRRAIETVERFADGTATPEEVRAADHEIIHSYGLDGPWAAVRWSTWGPWRNHDSLAIAVRAVTKQIAEAVGEANLPGLAHCVFGNPLQPVVVDPSWLTSTVLQLAEGIYADRAFDRMPVLADALMDAGCDKLDLLNHCRDVGSHARGCWVVDLLLGKS